VFTDWWHANGVAQRNNLRIDWNENTSTFSDMIRQYGRKS